MAVRQFGEKTHTTISAISRPLPGFSAARPRQSRETIQQVADGAQPPNMNSQASALRFFLTITLGRADLAHQLARTHYPRKLPRILSPEDVARLLEAVAIFNGFAELGSARRVWLWLRSEGFKFPLQRHYGAAIRWIDPSYITVYHVEPGGRKTTGRSMSRSRVLVSHGEGFPI